MSGVWTGQWVADRLNVALSTGSYPSPLALPDLVGLALRRNPRRVHLLVSSVLGKHLPTDPDVVYGAGRLLGAMVADHLAGRHGDIAQVGGAMLKSALDGSAAAASALLNLCARHAERLPDDWPTSAASMLVLGYAETATALGHAVADGLDVDYLHSTRRRLSGVPDVGGFEEEHSHATRHRLLPEDQQTLARPGPLVLVDDELSTGQTVLNTIAAMQVHSRRSRYVIAVLADLRSPADRARMASFGASRGVDIVVISLAAGHFEAPPGALAAGQRLVTEHDVPGAVPSGPHPARQLPLAGWQGVRDSGRHGFGRADRITLHAAADRAAVQIAARITGNRVLVLGFEELMYAPLLIAKCLKSRLKGTADIRFSTTTRSPVLAVDDNGYAIRTRLSFPSHDDPDDGPGMRFAYNVAPGADRARRFTDIVFVVDEVGDTVALHEPGGLLDQLSGCCDQVHLLTIRSYRPDSAARAAISGEAARSASGVVPALPRPRNGPQFGSYGRDEVSWLLTDLSDVALELPTVERERAFQSGRVHYAESLPMEFQPSAEYYRLFSAALASSAIRLAHAVGVVTEMVLAERGHGVVLVSLARAGTPVGVLMRRWAKAVHGLDLPHYAISIVRGRGIDEVALAYLAERHDPKSIMFVDGWTGKGAIARELTESITRANATLGLVDGGNFSPAMAVLADSGWCVDIYGTRDDYLVPSACLNSTVSGLVSRTVLNDDLIRPGMFHGAKFYAHLADVDVSRQFLDAISAEFTKVAAAVAKEIPALRDTDRAPTWAGWSAAETISAEYGIHDINLVKPGVGETTRVLLRRVPWKILMRPDAVTELRHIRMLAEQRGVGIELVDNLFYRCVGLIQPQAPKALAARPVA